MKVTRNLEISAAEFFDAVFDEMIQEIEKVDKQRVSKDSLKTGFHYIHNGEDVYSKIDYKIVEYQEEKFYKSVRTSFQGTTTVTYEVSPIENGISVTFAMENDEPATGKKPPKLFAMFAEGYSLGRMTDQLYNIQKKIINKKEGYEEKDFGSPLLPTIRRKI